MLLPDGVSYKQLLVRSGVWGPLLLSAGILCGLNLHRSCELPSSHPPLQALATFLPPLPH